MRILSFNDEYYPVLLKEIPKPPQVIYLEGDEKTIADAYRSNTPIVAIVGTRRPTKYGRDAAFALARDLASFGAIVVSGLAFGIDEAAHRGSIEGGGITWAVLGSGLNRIYPSLNKRLAKTIIENGGALFSEFPPETMATKWTFPQRNRIIAGLAQATIVVEAPVKSGALITARFALEANREVGAVPGEITSIHSQGTNGLLKEGAALIRNIDDILEIIGIERNESNCAIDNLTVFENTILHCLDEPRTIDDMLVRLSCTLPELHSSITALEIKGLIVNRGGLFSKKVIKS